jgi:succinate dehydrogenase/fumarate reductase flavoprotein subunit
MTLSSKTQFDESFDVIVAGFGLAGGIAALNAAQAGAKTLLIEKSPVPGGLSICSYGAVRSARDPQLAFHGAVIANSVEENALREKSGDPYRRQIRANYPLPGTDTFYHTTVIDVPGFNARNAYPWANGAPGGPKLFKIVHDHLMKHGVEIRLATPALHLIADPATREVRGVRVSMNGVERNLEARRGVVLTCGGFEGNADMKAQFFEGKPVLNAAARMNNGDGIRMAQHLGAALWHMWHIHGAYGFRHTDPNYPYGIRVKRMPDWFPGEADKVKTKMAWILVDQSGKRFMSEYQPYTQDTGVRQLQHFDAVTQRFSRNPSFIVFDEDGRKMYPLGKATSNDEGIRYEWSDDNLKEVGLGILKRADTLGELAQLLGIDAASLEWSVTHWNALCERGRDDDFARPAGSMTPITKPPFYGAPVWAMLSNTQGGPVHDAAQHIIDVYGHPIPRLYAAGELGSSFGHLYLSGGNIAECIVTGRIAGRNAAAES